jgi:3'(2'), 5'-bisphosphate nucleotidase
MPDPSLAFACALLEIAHDAGRLLLRHFAGDAVARRKADGSLVTAADEQAEKLITERLMALTPGIAVIAEEQVASHGASSPGGRFYLVDPLDGTDEFIQGRDEFTVNIALIEHGNSVCGVLIAPAKQRGFAGAKGAGAFELAAPADAPLDFRDLKTIAVRTPPTRPTILVSRSHRGQELELYAPVQGEIAPMSSSLKFGIVAAGEADLYPRTGVTMEWDTAAGQAVLEAAGGSVQTLDGGPLRYGKFGSELRNPGFIARGRT